MSELKHTFTSGRMNKDLDERLIPNGEYRDALNIQVSTSEGSDVGAIENVLGNKQIFDLQLTNAACIGAGKDLLNKKIYWFVTADELDGIYEYDTLNDIVVPILIDTKNTNTITLNDISFLSNDEEELILSNISKNNLSNITGINIDDIPLIENQEALILKNIDITVSNPAINISIPKNTILMLDKNNNYIFKNIKYTLKDLGNLSVNFLHSDGALLSFSKNNFINGVNVLDGLLFFTDNLNEPRVINIEKFKFYSNELLASDGTISKTQSTSLTDINNNTRELNEFDISLGVQSPQTSPILTLKDTLRDGTVSIVIDSFSFYRNNQLVLPNSVDRTIRVTYSTLPDWKIGDNILFEPTDDDADFNAILGIERILSNIITFYVVSYSGTPENKNYEIEQTLIEDESIYELKFPRFGYRWKYNDNRFSTFSPFSEVAFLPGDFKYDGKKGFNEGSINQTKKIILSDINIGPDTVKQIDILLKFDDDNNVYILDNKKRKDIVDLTLEIEITKEQIKSTVDNKQLLRQWDNIPKRAKSQEITGNRIIYGNYFQNYDIYNEPKFEISLRGRDSEYKRSIKSDRNYEIGVVYVDKFNRQTPVLTNDSGSFYVNKEQAVSYNAFNIKLTNNPPAWATHFKYFIKETSAEYYNLAADRFYFDDENGYVYISFSSAERNKVTKDTYLLLKKFHGKDEFINTRSNRYKILDIFNEPPEFVHEKITKIDVLGNVLFAQSYGSSNVQSTKTSGLTPVKDSIAIQIHSVNSDGTLANAPSGDYGFDSITKTNLKVGKYVKFEVGGKRTKKYRIKSLRYHMDGQDEAEVKFETPFGDDVDILYESTDAPKANINMEIYEDQAFAGDPEFNGRFFIKLETDGTLKQAVAENETLDDNIEYYSYASALFDGIDRNKDNFTSNGTGKGGPKHTPIFVNGGGREGADVTPYDKFADGTKASIVFEQTGPTDDTFFLNALSIGDRLRFSNQDTIYRIGRIQKETAKFRCSRRNGQKVLQVRLLFQNEDDTRQRITKTICEFDTELNQNNRITVELLKPLDDEKSNFTTNPAIFETEPIRQKTDLDIYFETEKAFLISEHGNINKLDWYNCFSFTNGVESNRIRDDFNAPFIKNGVKASTVLEEGYQEEHKFNGVIFSGIVNSKSSVNNSNQFLQAETITKDFLPSYGRIQKLHSWDDSLVVFLENKILRTPANKSALFNADGSTNLISSSNVIGNPIEYNGEYGISNDPQSFAVFGFRCYFVDRKNGKVFRLSKDGLTPISDVNMGDFFSDRLETTQTIFGSFDEDNQLYNLSFGTDADTVCFSEAINGWPTRKSFVPEFAVSINSKYYTFNNGNLWHHGNSGAIRNNFYGVQSFSQVQLEINDDPSTVKKFKTLVYEGTKGWTADIKTDLENSNDISFKRKENKYFANISGETKTALNLDLKKFNFQGIGRPASIDTIVDNRPNTTYNFSISTTLNINSSTVALPNNKPGELITKSTVNLILSPKTNNFKLLASDFSGTNCTFTQSGDNVKITYTHGFNFYPATTTNIQIPITGGRLIKKDVTLTGSYTVALSGCVDNLGNNTYSITGQPGQIVNIVNRQITANQGFKILKTAVTIDNPSIFNNSNILQDPNVEDIVDIQEKTVLPQFDESNRNYIITATAEQLVIPNAIIVSKKVTDNTLTLLNKSEFKTVLVKGEKNAEFVYEFKRAGTLLTTQTIIINDSEEFEIPLEFDDTDYTVARTYTLTFRVGNKTEFGTNFGATIITFTRSAVANNKINLKIVHDDISTSPKFADNEYSIFTRSSAIRSDSLQLTLNSSYAYQIIRNAIFPDDFDGDTDNPNPLDTQRIDNVTFPKFNISVGTTNSTDHIVTIDYKISMINIFGGRNILLDLNKFVNRLVTLTINYSDSQNTHDTGSNDDYTTAITGSTTIQGIAGSDATSTTQTDIKITTTSGKQLISGLGLDEFQLFDGSTNVTNTYETDGKLQFQTAAKGTIAIIRLLLGNFTFPNVNKTLTVKPTQDIIEAAATVNDYQLSIESIHGYPVIAPSEGASLDELRLIQGFDNGFRAVKMLSWPRSNTDARPIGSKMTNKITEISSVSGTKRLVQFTYTINRFKDTATQYGPNRSNSGINSPAGLARISKFANASTYSSNYRIKDMSGNGEFELAAAGSYTPAGGGSAVTVAGPVVLSNNNLTATINILINIHTVTSNSLTSGRARLQFAIDHKEDMKTKGTHIKSSKNEACKDANDNNTILIYNSDATSTEVKLGAWTPIITGNSRAYTASNRYGFDQYIKDKINDKVYKVGGIYVDGVKEILDACVDAKAVPPRFLQEIVLFASNTTVQDGRTARPQFKPIIGSVALANNTIPIFNNSGGVPNDTYYRLQKIYATQDIYKKHRDTLINKYPFIFDRFNNFSYSLVPGGVTRFVSIAFHVVGNGVLSIFQKMYGIYFKVTSRSSKYFNLLKPNGPFPKFIDMKAKDAGFDYYKLQYEIKPNNSQNIILIIKDVPYVPGYGSNAAIEFIALPNAFIGLASKTQFTMNALIDSANSQKHDITKIKNFIGCTASGSRTTVVGPHFGPQ